MLRSLVGSEMCIRDSLFTASSASPRMRTRWIRCTWPLLGAFHKTSENNIFTLNKPEKPTTSGAMSFGVRDAMLCNFTLSSLLLTRGVASRDLHLWFPRATSQNAKRKTENADNMPETGAKSKWPSGCNAFAIARFLVLCYSSEVGSFGSQLSKSGGS